MRVCICTEEKENVVFSLKNIYFNHDQWAQNNDWYKWWMRQNGLQITWRNKRRCPLRYLGVTAEGYAGWLGDRKGWEFAHFAQIKWATVSDSLRLLKTNEHPWANRSGCSEEMSDRERFAQILFYYVLFKVLDKKIRKNEQIAHFRSFPLFWLAMWVNCSFRSNQMSDVS